MTFETLDFLTDASVLGDPSQYYDYLRECPVRHVPPHGMVAVTGYEELVSVFHRRLWRAHQMLGPPGSAMTRHHPVQSFL